MNGTTTTHEKRNENMTNQDRFKQMAAEIGRQSGHPRLIAWDDVQDWKVRTENLVSDIFSENPKLSDSILGRIRGCFCAQPRYAFPDGSSSSPIPDAELQRIFDCDIVEAQAIMHDCCHELERLAEKYK